MFNLVSKLGSTHCGESGESIMGGMGQLLVPYRGSERCSGFFDGLIDLILFICIDQRTHQGAH